MIGETWHDTSARHGPDWHVQRHGMDEHPPTKTPIARVILAWIFVGTPLLWGVFQTLKKAGALFR